MVKESKQKEDITLLDIYRINITVLKYFKQILIDKKEEIHKNTVTVGDFKHPIDINE